MSGWLNPDVALRVAFFAATLAGLLMLERSWPRRTTPLRRGLRWPSNFGLALINGLWPLALPVALIGVAVQAQHSGWGLLARVEWSPWLELGLALVALDLAIYAQHRALHAVPALWRLHRVHHSDIEFDTSTGLRFHPLEILLSLLWKAVVVLSLGITPLAVLAFEVALNAGALFSHANLRLRGDAALRWLLVTPDMHRVHHSPELDESNRNFGTLLAIWDRAFGSYRAQPREGHAGMTIGLDHFRAPQQQKISALLLQPARSA